MPKWIDDAVGFLFKVHTQEDENSLEFLSAWLLSFLLLVITAAVAAVIWRWRKRLSSS